MVHVSRESDEETEARLRRVIAESSFVVHPGSWVFEEFPLGDFAVKAREDALALVRDDTVWSQLVPSSPDGREERFLLFSFHFDDCVDNSGFVGWLATHLKRELGTGVFVTCGQNSERGGIFDYWGAPESMGDAVLAEVGRLRGD